MVKNNNNKMRGFKVKKKKIRANTDRRMVVSSGANFGTQSSINQMQRLTLNSARGLDAGGLKYLNLLSDPCNAAFTGPAYEGEGSGLFFRTRTLVTPSGAVDSILQLSPQFLHDNFIGSSITLSQQAENSPIMYNYSGSSGTALGSVSSVAVSKGLFGSTEIVGGVQVVTGGSFGSARPIAACIKVGYSGTVMNLSGKVYAKIGSQQTYSQVGSSTASFIDQMGDCPQIDDLRSRVHEYRWVPAFQDQQWIQTPAGRTKSADTPYIQDSVQHQGQTLTVGVQNAPAGTITYEITIVWEAQVNPGTTSDLLTSTTAPPTGSTLNQVLRELGNVGQWALSGKGQEQITGMFQGAGNLARTIKGGVADLFKIF